MKSMFLKSLPYVLGYIFAGLGMPLGWGLVLIFFGTIIWILVSAFQSLTNNEPAPQKVENKPHGHFSADDLKYMPR